MALVAALNADTNQNEVGYTYKCEFIRSHGSGFFVLALEHTGHQLIITEGHIHSFPLLLQENFVYVPIYKKPRKEKREKISGESGSSDDGSDSDDSNVSECEEGCPVPDDDTVQNEIMDQALEWGTLDAGNCWGPNGIAIADFKIKVPCSDCGNAVWVKGTVEFSVDHNWAIQGIEEADYDAVDSDDESAEGLSFHSIDDEDEGQGTEYGEESYESDEDV